MLQFVGSVQKFIRKVNMTKVGITGVNGFLGLPLAKKLLELGYEVVGLDNFYRPKTDALKWLCEYSNFKFVYGDICDTYKIREAFTNVNYVFHLAALVGEPISKQFPDLAERVNVRGTETLLANIACPVIYHSTGSVYGKVEDICTENSPTNPLSVYGVTKLKAEELIVQEGGIGLRLSTAFGLSGNHRVKLLVNDFVDRAVNDRTLTVFQSEFKRSFVYTSDVVDADIAAMENWPYMTGQVFNVGHPKGNWTKRELAEYLKKRTGCHVVYADEGYQDPDQRSYEIDFSKMKPYWEAKVSIEDGIEKLINSASVDSIKF